MVNIKVILFVCYIHFCASKENDTDNIQNLLMDEERNARCCAQHLDCGKNCSETTSFEVRALLIKCIRPEPCCDQSPTHVNNKQRMVAEGQCGNAEEDTDFPEITSCDKKLKLTLKIKNVGITNIKNQFIIIDHVFDPLTEKKQKLQNPYVVKIKQEPILQVYGLSLENMVNSEAKEKVINKNNEGYTGCNTDVTQNPTCGAMKYDDEAIPYSTGFCCSCSKDQIEQNIEDSNFTSNLNSTIISKKARNADNIDVPGYNKNNYDHDEVAGKVGNVKEDIMAINIPNAVDNNDNFGTFQTGNEQRLIPVSDNKHFVQKRGGQDCSDKSTPPNVNPDTYHASTHCLEFSDLWYSVYCLHEPKLYHSLQVQIYEKCQDQDGNFKWTDLTNNLPITLGTTNRFYSNDDNTLIASYMAREVNVNMFSINHKIKKLLIPDSTKIVYNDSYPELNSGPEQYLVVNENQVRANGKSCNTAGVGFEAFAKQPNRCSKPKGTCLQNQPKHLWTHDHELEAQGKTGSYFLKYYGILPENPIESVENCQNKTLKMLYTQPYTSILDFEIKSDSNVVLRPNSLAVITEVYVDSSSPKRTAIIVKVFNSGLVSSLFFVGLTQCPLDLPASFNNIVSKPALIAPQYQHVFKLKIECPLPVNSFFCAVEVLNTKEELIAFRKIRLQKLDRCICVWHCLCACLLADKGLKCDPMSLEHYHAAGFQGSLPVSLHEVQYTFLDDMISLILYILLFLFLTLLIMGLTKAIAGCFMVVVGLWGLDIILELPKKMNSYYELDLKHRQVIYDENGWPIHPDTRDKVRNISLPAEFSINVVFFFIYPFALMWTIIKRLCFSSYPTKESEYDMCTCKSDTLVKKRNSSLQLSTNKFNSTDTVIKANAEKTEQKPAHSFPAELSEDEGKKNDLKKAEQTPAILVTDEDEGKKEDLKKAELKPTHSVLDELSENEDENTDLKK